MDKATLVRPEVEDESKLINAGRRLIESLDRSDFEVIAALWLYLSEPDEWRLIIASPTEHEKGPRKAYIAIQSVLNTSLPPIEIPLQNISVVSPDDNLIRTLQGLISTGSGISGIRFKQCSFNNLFIEDAYIYRV